MTKPFRPSPHPSNLTRIFIADDHPIIRMGIRSVLNQQPDLLISGEAETSKELIERVPLQEPHIVLLDAKLKDGMTFDTCRQLTDANRALKVIIFVSMLRGEWIERAMACGSHGVLSKRVGAAELLNAIRTVLNGKMAIDPEVTEFIVRSIQGNRAQDRMVKLSAQEKVVLRHLSHGRTNKEIADSMSLSEKTIKNYLGNAMEKLGVSRRTEAAVYYSRHLRSVEEE